MSRQLRPRSQRARLAPRTQQFIEATRAARFALQRVTEQVSARTKDVMTLDEAGNNIIGRVQLEESERIERLQSAMSWLAKAEDETRRLRGLLERTLEEEWKHL